MQGATLLADRAMPMAIQERRSGLEAGTSVLRAQEDAAAVGVVLHGDGVVRPLVREYPEVGRSQDLFGRLEAQSVR